MEITDQIRTAAAQVSARAGHVRVNEDVIASYAAALAAADPAPVDAAPDEPDAAAYWLALNAINFGSGWFPTLLKLPGMTGFRTIEAGVKRRFKTDGAWTAAQLRRITTAELSMLTGQLPEHPLMALFKASLQDLGRHVEADYGGDFAAVAADKTAVELVTELSNWACFADQSRYQELEVPFLKRAQIVAADLDRTGIADFGDIARLTMFADNLVPHVLRLDGVLSFDPELVSRIEAGELIEYGAPEEVEYRAAAVHAVELIVKTTPQPLTASTPSPAAAPQPLTAAAVDRLLWYRGQGARYKAVPRPRCRCTAY